MRISSRLAVAFALVGGVYSPSPSLAAGEKALPASTVGYLKIEDASKLRAQFKASQFGQLLADPAIEPLKQDVIAQMEEPSKKVQEILGVTLGELLTLPQGAVTIAFVNKGGDDPKHAIALLASADAGENQAKMADVMAKATKEAGTKNKVATEKFKDSTLTIIRENDDDKEPLVWTQVGSTFHISSDVDALKDLISNLSGRAQSLATNENFQSTMKGLGGSPQVSLFVDVTQIIKLAVAAAPGGNAAQLEDQLQLTGINGFKALGAGFDFNQGDFDQVLKIFLYSPGPAQGLLKVFAMPPIDLKPQAWVPASANAYQSLSWDFDAAWKAVSDLAKANGMDGIIAQAQQGIGGPNGDFDFKKDLFGPLGNRLSYVSDFRKPITEKSQRALAAVALDDEKAFQNTFNKILELTHASPKKRDFQGVTIYDFEVPANLPNAGQNGLNIEGPISVAIAKGNLFISTEPTFLELALRSGGPALVDSPEYQAVAKKLPAKNSLISFDRTEEQARLLYNMVKGDGLQKALDQANANNGAKVKNPIDPKKIPDFSVFAKYLGQGGTYGIQDEQGMTITSFMLHKEKP